MERDVATELEITDNTSAVSTERRFPASKGCGAGRITSTVRMVNTFMLPGRLVATILIAFMGIAPATIWAAHASKGPPSFTVTNLGTLPGGFDSEGFGISSSGDVVGSSGVVTGKGKHREETTHAFLYQRGKLIDLGAPPGALASYGYGVNDTEMVAAAAKLTHSEAPYSASFRHGRRVWTPLPSFNGSGTLSVAHGINNSGVLVGSAARTGAAVWQPKSGGYRLTALTHSRPTFAEAIDSRGDVVGYRSTGPYPKSPGILWVRGRGFVSLPTLGGMGSEGLAVVAPSSTAIEVAGSAQTKVGGERATIWRVHIRRGRWTVSKPRDLGVQQGFAQSEASGVNAAGLVVGFSFKGASYEACLWDSGTVKLLNSLIPKRAGWNLVRATAINMRSQITGWGATANQQRAFLLTPRG